MAVRIASAAVGIPLAILMVFGWGGVMFAPAVGILAIIGAYEFYRGARRLGAEPLAWLGITACFLMVVSAGALPAGVLTRLPSLVLALLFMAGLLVELLRPQRAPIRDVGATVLGAVYVGWLLSFLVLLRNLTGQGPPFQPPLTHLGLTWLDTGSYGAWLVLFLLFVTWAYDTGAYFAGRFLGKHKLAPAISPGKTIEGAAGGIVGSVVVAYLAGGFMAFPVWTRIAAGALIAVMAMIGDLTESAMKREIGIKDFGAIMPGHGGVLDRLDSMLFTAPTLFYFLLLVR
jgi:phosphatidate cytidylyltransferase